MDGNSTAGQSTRSLEGILRIRRAFNKKDTSRRVSCKDLGYGDCEGWLWKKAEKPGFVSREWKKFWFTLKDKSLYYYKNKDDEMAQGIFQMPAFIVSPACDKDSSRKFAFKACHRKFGTFLFASERKEDMVKWMNMIQVACLPDYNPKQLKPINSVTDDYSGSESEDDTSTGAAAATSSLYSNDSVTTTDTIPSDYCASPESESPSCSSDAASALLELTLHRNARSVLERSIRRKSKEDRLQRLYTHLASLQRTLKDKENQLNFLEDFFSDSCPVTPDALQIFFSSSSALVAMVTERNIADTTDNSIDV